MQIEPTRLEELILSAIRKRTEEIIEEESEAAIERVRNRLVLDMAGIMLEVKKMLVVNIPTEKGYDVKLSILIPNRF